RMLPMPPKEGEQRRLSWLERGSNAVYRPIERLYSAGLAFCLRRRWVVGIAIVVAFGMTVPVWKKVGGGFLPPDDEAQFEIYIQTPEDTTLEATTLFAERLARQTRELPEVESTLVSVADGDQRQPNVGHIYIHLTDPDKRSRSQAAVMEQVREDI